MYKLGKQTKKITISLAVSFFLSVQVLGVFIPQAVLAVGAPDVVAKLVQKDISDSITEGLLSASLGALVNGFSYFMRKLAYDTATYIASGGKGQGALAFNKGAAAYFSEVALDSAASAIEQFGSPLGLDLCKPPDLKFQIFLQVGIRKLYADPGAGGGPTPKCSWNDFKTSWEKGFENFDEKAGDFASQAFVRSLKVDQSDFGVAFGLISKVDRINANAKTGAKTSREEGGGYKAVTDLISGNIKTPADVIREETKALTGKNQADLSSQQIAGIYGAGLWQVIPAAAGVFVNTLVSQVMQTIMTEGILPDSSSGGGAATESAVSSAFSEYAGVINNNKAAAQNAFNFLFTAIPTQQLTTYPLLEEMSDCLNPDNPGLNNCVLDPGFRDAIKRANTGKALTIREAMDAKNNFLLHPDWALVPPSHEYNTNPRKCYNDNYYCYSNIQKLRRARIVPLGFEIAAAKADPDQLQNWTLGKVVAGFYDCDPNGQPSLEHPFCHLIDPDWILRLPEPRCDAKVFGPKLLASGNPARREECVGISTCLKEDEKGQCLGDYGYCLREKNTWRFGGSICPAQYNTCTTYTNTANNSRVSYLSRTVEFGQCNAQSVGCRVYSTEPKSDGTWRNTGQSVNKTNEISTGKNPAIYFNDSIKNYTCPASADGCSVLSRAVPVSGQDRLAYLKKAPNTLFDSCYLITNHISNKKVWPDNDGDIAELLKRPINNKDTGLCKPFAPACTKDEAGCEAYKPVTDNDADTITGIVGANQCSAQCIGYDTFKQEIPVDKGAFEPAVFPLQFIPSQAKSCLSQYEGCAEFTNVDEAGAGGEKLEYYSDLEYCEKPTGTNEKTFYSWEGSASLGYVIQNYKLRPISSDKTDRYNTNYLVYLTGIDTVPSYTGIKAEFSAGSPAYVDDSQSVIIANYLDCNKTSYEAALKNAYVQGAPKPDCRALYDESGKVFYRLLSKTIVVSPACHPLRKTESILRIDLALSQQNELMCEAKGGKWDDGAPALQKCQLCYNGGIYNNGVCIYWTTSQPGKNNSCVPEANNCRAYTGPAANTIQSISEQKFEPEDNSPTALTDLLAGWSSGLLVKPESLTVGQNSLEINIDQAEYTFVTSTLETDKFYELEFWSRGVQQNLEISFVEKGVTPSTDKIVGNFTYDPVTAQTVKVPISQTWQSYRVGPVQFTGDGTRKIVLRITRTAMSGVNGAYYLDNLRLTKVKEKLYLIKNSWKQVVALDNGTTVQADVPLTCDANPTDGLPGSALGCRAYTDSLNNPLAITGFDRLCREDAVGCTAFYDLQNTVNEHDTTAFNLWCTGTQNTKCTLKVGSNELGSCDVLFGETGCFIPKVALESAVYTALLTQVPSTIVKSTIIIPADTPTSSPIYLSYRQRYACDTSNVGCQKIALEDHIIPNSTATSAYKFTESYIKNNPENYEQILCAQEQLGCSAFKSDNNIDYFKDPTASGSAICSYKEKTKGFEYAGWFQEGVGKCSATDPAKSSSNNLCKETSDCESGESCTGVGAVPCYSNYLIAGGEYGIWSNKSAEYNGAVGRCAEQYNQCTELIDPLDYAQGKPLDSGKSYYVIFNQKLLQDAGQCEGKVNLKQGCALFNATNNPTLRYNAAETYKISDGVNAQGTDKYGPIDPITTGATDTNVLLKVNRDRSCSEWLGCKDKVRVTDQTGKQRTICAQYKACRATEVGSSCTNWSPLSTDDINRLTEEAYVGRDVSWYGEDYSGYSLFNKYRIGNTISVVFDGDAVAYLAFLFNPAVLGNNQIDIETYSCKSKNEWAKCGFNDFGGRCYEKKCIYPLYGSFPDTVNSTTTAAKYLEIGSCKAFPEKTSPFASSIIENLDEGKKYQAFAINQIDPKYTRLESQANLSGFERANYCQNGDCSCEYKKITYKNGVTDYRTANTTEYPQGICSDLVGDKAGQACNNDAECSSAGAAGAVTIPGVCSRVRDVETHTGLRGFCLERDFSRPINLATNEYACLTWLPTDTAATNFDQYNKFPGAGYYPAEDAVKLSVTGEKIGEFGKVYCTEASGNGLGVLNTNSFPNNFNPADDYPFNNLNSYTGAYKNISNPDDFKNRSYAVAQMWAWSGAELKPFPNITDNAYTIVGTDGSFTSGVYNETSFPKPGENGFMSPQDFDTQGKNKIPTKNFSVTNSSAVVLFTSGLSFNTYFTFLKERTVSVKSEPDIKGGQKFCEGPEQQDPETGQYYCPTVYKYQQSWSSCPQTTVEGQCTKLSISKYEKPSDFPESEISFFKTTTQYGKSYNITSDVTMYKDEIAKLKFGPILAPPNIMKNINTAQVMTIDFDKLNTTDPNFSGEYGPTTLKNIKYKYTYYINGFENKQSGLFVFKIMEISDGDHKDETIYGAIALSDEGTQLNKMHFGQEDLDLAKKPLDFFKRWMDELAGENTVNYQNSWTFVPTHSFVLIYCNFDKNGVKKYCSNQIDYADNYKWLETYFGWKSDVSFATPYFAEIVELKPRCTEFVQVYDENPTDSAVTRNKAWTNRVWKDVFSDSDYSSNNPNIPSINRNVDLPPFGSLNLSLTSLSSSGWENVLRHYIFDDPAVDGAFFSCTGDVLDQKLKGTAVSFEQILVVKSNYSFWDSYSCNKPENPNAKIYSQIGPENETFYYQGKIHLGNLFNKIFKEFNFNSKSGSVSWSDVTYALGIGDSSTNNISVLMAQPPQIYSLNINRCYSSDNTQKCIPAESNAFTINRHNGTINEDIDKDGLADPLINRGSLTAVADFFAFADHNRMPIKRVMINWGDGLITNQNQYGEYKNKKPFCLTDDTDPNPKVGECSVSKQVTCLVKEDCPLTSETCTINGHNFGNSTRACEANYFEYVHGYSCSQADADIDADYVYKFNELNNGQGTNIESKIWDALKKQGYTASANPFVCIFKPKIQILDNWGWCTGSCNGAGNTGCYTAVPKNTGGVNDLCDSTNPDSFIKYKGTIVVVP